MKLFVFVVCFVATAHSGPNLRNGYLLSPNVESVFKYTSPNLIKAMRKTIQPSSIIAGHPLKFEADLKLQAFSDSTLRVKLDHIQFYTNGNAINLKNAHQILEDGRSIRTGMHHTEQTFQQFLTAPFLIHMKRGIVKKVIVSRNEPSEVTSIKKLIASDLENNDRHPQFQLVMKKAIIIPLQTPRYPMKVDLEEPENFDLRLKSKAESGRNADGQKFGGGAENITTSDVAIKDFGSSASNCEILPNSPYTDFAKGCKGAVWESGSPSKDYCTNVGAATGRFQWYKDCCEWKNGECIPKESLPCYSMCYTEEWSHLATCQACFANQTLEEYCRLYPLTDGCYGVIPSECPNNSDLPVLNEKGDAFYCAFTWNGHGDKDLMKACDGNRSTWMDGQEYDYSVTNEDYNADLDTEMIPVGSIMVKTGCTLKGYEDRLYRGRSIEYAGPNSFPSGCKNPDSERPPSYDNGCPFDLCPMTSASSRKSFYGFRSVQCRCRQEPIACTPSDGWVMIIQCDNTLSSVEASCAYTKTIGTTWSESASDSMSIDASIEYSMTLSFFAMFEESLGVSSSTGYDWSKTSSQAKSESESFEVSATVPPYTLLQIKGAQGKCGANTVNTELFKLITLDSKRKIINENLERSIPRPMR